MDKESQKIEVNVPENSIVIKKSTYGIKEKDIEILKLLGVNEVDVCGVQTDACVYVISLNLFDNNIFPNVLINYTQTVSNEAQENCKKCLFTNLSVLMKKNNLLRNKQQLIPLKCKNL